MTLIRKGLAIVIILLFVGTAIIPSSGQKIEKLSLPMSRGNTLYVGGSGPGNYSTIQSAIDNASDGDIIFIYKGTYYETPWVNKSLSIIGEDPEFTVIDGKQNQVNNIFSVNASSFNLRGVTIQNSSYWDYGIYLKNIHDRSIIKNCTLLTNRGIGIFFPLIYQYAIVHFKEE